MCLLYFSVYIFRKWHRTLWRRTKKYTFPGTDKNFLRTQCGWEDMYNIKWGGLLAVKLWWECRGHYIEQTSISACHVIVPFMAPWPWLEAVYRTEWLFG